MVTAYLATPAGITNPPVVIALHGLTQSKDQWWLGDGPWSFPSRHREILLNSGIAVLAIDLRNHGERILENDFENPLTYLTEGYFESARKMIAESALDVRRAIDYLEARADIDHSRLGVIGFSLGAHVAWIATAVDPRIDRSLIMGMALLPAPKEHKRGGFTGPRNYLAGLKGRAVMVLAATRDEFYSVEQANGLFEEVPSALKEISWVDSGHDMPASTAQVSKYWFAGKL
jgi:dienelactone hydrolase